MQPKNMVVRHYLASPPFPSNAEIYEMENGSVQITVPPPSDAVLKDFQLAIDGSESDARLGLFFAMSLIQVGQWREAETQVREGLRYNPHHDDLHMLLAEIHDHNGSLHNAVSEARLAVSLMSAKPERAGTQSEAIALEGLAQILLSAGYRHEAIETFQRAADLLTQIQLKDQVGQQLIQSVQSTLAALIEAGA
jgi:tetratricopeptide (TPR) repeat protein